MGYWGERVKVPASMVVVQLLTTGMVMLSRVALSEGMFVFSLLAYRNAIGALFVAPFAFFLEREMRRQLTYKAFLWIFINALFGITMSLGLYYYGLRDTSAAYSCNFLNLIPIVTFVFAVVIRVERLGVRSKVGKIKALGSVACVAGAIIFGTYKGRILHIWPSHVEPLRSVTKGKSPHLARGTFLLIGSCFSYAFWFIIQVKLLKIFPSKYWTTTLTCMVGSFQTVIIGIFLNRQKEAWRLNWNLQLLTFIYSGILNTGATFCLISWVIAQRGPTYPSMFNPLAVVFTTILESFFIGQEITSGSLLGMVLIFGGLYGFLWAKRKEHEIQIKRSQRERESPPPSSESLHSCQSVTVVPVPDEDELSSSHVCEISKLPS
ncbi:WAT1-related protein [Apostasia shenzhenica]|uniref:WAT1-related protein n=1 Tax=Apostasia shenzhenica TaxID=1088818 RepID=A0A2I0AYR5_9ASPA|nr:WAT1-related protein [Apostasia shenzhenica]